MLKKKYSSKYEYKYEYKYSIPGIYILNIFRLLFILAPVCLRYLFEGAFRHITCVESILHSTISTY